MNDERKKTLERVKRWQAKNYDTYIARQRVYARRYYEKTAAIESQNRKREKELTALYAQIGRQHMQIRPLRQLI